MLADINLLPEKEKKDGTWLVVAGVLLILLFMVYLSTHVIEAKIQETVSVLEEEQQRLSSQIQEESAQESGAVTELNDLQNVADNLRETIVPASDLTHRVTKSLPEGGYIATFDYTYPSTLNLTVQVNEVNEAADFQHTLQEETVFSDVSMESIQYFDPLEENPERFHENERIPRYEAVFDMAVEGQVLRQSGDSNES
ncbi:hypothetical protein D7Z54_14355 [Salibacterium salarium]|uniref:Type IV pilus assembly protein PilN n=1 Tax=Salibacterium salarium TaxID=284579 RepID=A0A3R9P8F5_9BACI|nr:hypothetical protein [Salibacterium salarium]RSL32629.1 hypothetical protein D7Z54_14355 [Salibacterium salarium]